jgi:hypothetical protein
MIATIHNLPETITDAALLDFTGATGTYTGKARRCCCGCSGNHSQHKASITRQINRITALVKAGHAAEVGPNNIAVEVITERSEWGEVINGRLYIVYFD